MKFLSCLFLSVILVSCGYTMRGNIELNDNVKKISISSISFSPLVVSISDSLRNSNIQITNSKNKNLYRINIISENFKRRQLSINAAGRVNEYEIIYDVSFQVSPPSEKSDIETITLYRDYSFDENNIMGNVDREEYIKNEMIATAATLIYNRLSAKVKQNN